MSKKQLDDDQVEIGWILNNELRLAVEEREILLTAKHELLKDKKSVKSRLTALEMLSRLGKGFEADG